MSRFKCSLCASACARVKLLRGFWARGRVRGDRSVFVTSHRPVHSSCAPMFSAWFELCTSMSLDLELAKILDEFAVPEAFRTKLLDSACLKVWQFAEYVDDVKDWTSILSPVSSHRSWTACTSRRSDAHTKQRVRETPSFSPGVATLQAKIWTHQSSRMPGTTVSSSNCRVSHPIRSSGRLDREKDRSTFTVINLAKVASVAAQSAHTKHIEVAPGISFNLGTHEPPEAIGDSKAMGLAEWLLNLRIQNNCYSIIGVRKVATSANCEAMWCSWQVVS